MMAFSIRNSEILKPRWPLTAALDASEAQLAEATQRFEALDRAYDAVTGRDNEGAFTQAINLMAENDFTR